MAEMKAKIEDIDGLLSSIRTNKDGIDISVSSINDPSKCKGIMLSKYIECIRNISDLLDKYKQLLEKDISDISNSKDKIQEMDQEMTNLSKSI